MPKYATNILLDDSTGNLDKNVSLTYSYIL